MFKPRAKGRSGNSNILFQIGQLSAGRKDTIWISPSDQLCRRARRQPAKDKLEMESFSNGMCLQRHEIVGQWP